MELRTFIDAYIDVNILLALSLGLWFIARRVLVALGLSHAYATQLRLLNGVFVATMISPVLAALVVALASASPIGAGYSLNISDFVTAQYLNGSFEMTPSTFESALGFRSRLLSGVEYLDSPLGVGLVTLVGLGFLFSSVRLLVGVCRLCRIVRASTVWRRFGAVELRVSDTVPIPFSTRSLTKRIIVVPSSLVSSPDDLMIALNHEFQHLRQHDLEWEIALEALRPFFFWNPAYAIWKRKFEVLRELSCDQNVVARRQRIAPETYCRSLLNICENSLKPPRLIAVEVPRVALVETRSPWVGRCSASLLKQRMKSLLEGKKERNPRQLFALFFAPLLIATMVGSVAIQTPQDWSYDRLMLSTIVNLERLAVRNGTTGSASVGLLGARPNF